MLHRVKKKKDLNAGKWIGVGGKFEDRESPEDCLLREVQEETGLTLTDYRFRGLITFLQEGTETEYMCLYTATEFTGTLPPAEEDGTYPCAEGVLAWIPKDRIEELNLWEGDRVFLRLLAKEAPFFTLKLVYQGDALVESILHGVEASYLETGEEETAQAVAL